MKKRSDSQSAARTDEDPRVQRIRKTMKQAAQENFDRLNRDVDPKYPGLNAIILKSAKKRGLLK